MKRQGLAGLTVAGFFAAMGAQGPATAKPLMKPFGKIVIQEGVISEGFAFDEQGSRFAYIVTDAKGTARFQVGPPGGKVTRTDLTSFSPSPERVIPIGGSWFVIANEGQRRAAVLGPNGGIRAEIGPFTDGFISTAKGKAFVAVTDRGEKAAGHSYNVAAYRPQGGLLGQKQITIAGDGALVGTEGLGFVAFTNGYLQLLVKKPGRYNAKTDVRGGTEIAVFDVLSWKAGPGRNLPDIPRFLSFAQKRNEKPGFETFVRIDDDGKGLELVGPGEKLRPLGLPSKFALYEPSSLQQETSGGRLVFSMAVDPLNPDQVAAGKQGPRSLHIFAVDVGSAKATLLGEIPLDDDRAYAWATGGAKIAFLKKTLGSGGTEISLYQR